MAEEIEGARRRFSAYRSTDPATQAKYETALEEAITRIRTKYAGGGE